MVFFDPFHIRRRVLRLVAAATGLFFLFAALATYYALAGNAALPPSVEQPFPENKKRVAITFDDGPHPTYTQAIAATLERHRAPATFFFLGSAMLRNPTIAPALHNRGFTIGNHTFTHSKNAQRSERRLSWELNATETIIREQTGVQPIFYRPPYLNDIWGHTLPSSDIPAVAWAEEEGYRVVGATIDSYDWTAKTPDDIVKNVRVSLDNKNVQEPFILLLHDDKQLTAEALDSLIRMLKDIGYEIVPLEDLIGITAPQTRYPEKNMAAFLTTFFYGLMRLGSEMLQIAQYVLLCVLVIIFIRFFLLCTLFFHSRTHKKQYTEPFHGSISVLVPAYNEEQNLAATLESIMQNTRLPDEIIVVNDASRDNTHEVIESVRKKYPDIMRILIFLENKGKASALNAALREARGDVFLAIDGDTILDRRAIDYITRPFVDEQVGGVAGKVTVARPHNILTLFQSIEYEIAQNVEKTAFDTMGIISVIPGALGAWRRLAARSVGGYGTDTLVEDQDITIAILRAEHRITYEAQALAYTEAPSSLSSFLKQRFRWTYGTLQCLWKHRDWLQERSSTRKAVILYVNNSLFSILFPVLSLFVELSMLLNLFIGNWRGLLTTFLVFQTLDFIYAVMGAGFWRRQMVTLFFALPAQRIFHRYVSAYIVIRSCMQALAGTHARWEAIRRIGTARMQFTETSAIAS